MKMATKVSTSPSDNLPKSVKVGWRDYAIEEWGQAASVSADRYGECSHAERKFRVALGYGTQQGASTLLHEIMRAIHAVWQIHDDDNEERTVKMLQQGLSTVWRDNPAVMHWIGWHIQHGS